MIFSVPLVTLLCTPWVVETSAQILATVHKPLRYSTSSCCSVTENTIVLSTLPMCNISVMPCLWRFITQKSLLTFICRLGDCTKESLGSLAPSILRNKIVDFMTLLDTHSVLQMKTTLTSTVDLTVWLKRDLRFCSTLTLKLLKVRFNSTSLVCSWYTVYKD